MEILDRLLNKYQLLATTSQLRRNIPQLFVGMEVDADVTPASDRT